MLKSEHKRWEEMLEKIKEQVIAEAYQMRVTNKTIPISGRRIDLPVNGRIINVVLYEARQKNAPLILGYHGGGFLFGGNALNDKMWAEIADRMNVNVASVEYRKSPDFMYRDAIEDAYDSAIYLKEHWSEFGFNPLHISVLGCSAGANLATALCIYAEETKELKFDSQILLYPFLDADTDPDSKGEGSMTGPIMYIFNDLHSRQDERRNVLVSPLFASDEQIKGLPASIIVLAEKDNLKYEGKKYIERLEKMNVPVSRMVADKMPHGYFETGFGEVAEKEYGFLGEDVKRLVETGAIAKKADETLDFILKNFKR